MKTISEEERLTSSSSNKLSTQILPVDTLLINLPLPQLHLLRVPNNQEYKCTQGILDWAEISPKSKIYFIVNRAGLKPEQLKRLEIIENELQPASNIQVVDFQQVLKDERFEHLKEYCVTFEEKLKLPGALHTIYTVSKEHRVNLSSYNELSTQILPEDTPLMFQWIPLSLGRSIPNTQEYPYLQRIVDWAQREPQRMIYVVVNGAGLEPEQLKKLETEFEPLPKIKVVDYQIASKQDGYKHIQICFKSNDNDKELITITISDLLGNMYGQPIIVQKVHSSNIIDASRLEVILNRKMITSHESIIYLDLDVLPSKDNKQIGHVSIPGGILFASHLNSESKFKYLENSIIAVNNESQGIIENMCTYVAREFQYYLSNRDGLYIAPESVYASMRELINLYYYHREQGILLIDDVLRDQQAFEEYHEKFQFSLPYSRFNALPEEWYEQFRFDKNGGNVVVTSDKSWMDGKNIYSSAELPLYFNKVQYQTTVATALSHPPTDLNHVATEDIPVSDNRAEVSKEITELPLSQERYEDLCSVYEDYCSTYEDFY